MNTVNVREFYAAGLGFSIVDADADFGDDGELSGYHEITDELYQPREFFRESEGLTDTTTLTDDHPGYVESAGYNDDGTWEEASLMIGRWKHLRDTHLEEQRSEARALQTVEPRSRVHGEMEVMARWRKERYARLVRWVARQKNVSKLREAKRGIWKRYIETVKSCAKSGWWWAIYLTKEQVRDVSAQIDNKLK